MKNKIIAMMSLVLVMVVAFGCMPEQIKAVSQQLGLASAVTWIAADNPSQEVMNAAEKVMDVIKQNADEVGEGSTYTEVVYPEVVKFIDESGKIKLQYRPAAKASAIWILGGIDMLFASNPEWKQEEKTAIEAVEFFIVGVKIGLNLSEDDPRIKIARTTGVKRFKAYTAN